MTRTTDPDRLGSLTREIAEIWKALDEIRRPSGTQLVGLVEQVKVALASVDTKVQNSIAQNSYTRAQIDSKIASPGAISPTSVNSSGFGTFAGGLSSVDVYSYLVTGGGQYRSAYVHESGRFGYAPSSAQFKHDIRDVPSDPATVAALKRLRPRTFQYWAAAPYSQAMMPLQYGLIAEEVHALGLTWLVDYDETGAPFGVRYDLLPIAGLMLMSDIEQRLTAAGI